MALPAWTPGWDNELAPPVSALVPLRDGADGLSCAQCHLPPSNTGKTEMGLAGKPFHGSTQAPVSPRVDKLSFTGRSLWDALFETKLRRGRAISSGKSCGVLLVLGTTACAFCLSLSLPLRTHLDSAPLHLLGVHRSLLSLQLVLGTDPGISHLYTAVNVMSWILDTGQ